MNMSAKSYLSFVATTVSIFTLSVIFVSIAAEIPENVVTLNNTSNPNVTVAAANQSISNQNMTNLTTTSLNQNTSEVNNTAILDLNATAGNITGTSRRH
jgi:CCR4-NOT transcriptional regulation complex NOT5 subunit